jgi:MFS superfamily sulfate permease-like transporter
MHDGVRTDYNKELRAQGVGNFLCGVFGALPMTGVIVRSSANVQAGAKTACPPSCTASGFGFVALLPWLLREVPMAALGAVLVVTGWKLVSLDMCATCSMHMACCRRRSGSSPSCSWSRPTC